MLIGRVRVPIIVVGLLRGVRVLGLGLGLGFEWVGFGGSGLGEIGRPGRGEWKDDAAVIGRLRCIRSEMVRSFGVGSSILVLDSEIENVLMAFSIT